MTDSVGGPYVGRFAPSPTGLLHAGSLVAALASWLDARACGGRWLVRIEDLDAPRKVDGAAEAILGQLARCSLRPDEAPLLQSTRTALYERALGQLLATGRAYPCACSRGDLARAAAPAEGDRLRHAELVYPGTCRAGLHGRPARSIRLRTSGPAAAADPPEQSGRIAWTDRRLGEISQDVPGAVGDFVLRRADGVWAYQLAVVVDDADQGVTDVVRGEDLAGNTARQIVLQRCLGLATPRYLHTPLVLAANGDKLSKQTGATPLALDSPLDALRRAAAVLGLVPEGTNVADWLAAAVAAWRKRFPLG
ncbi:MAG: tRNA glutamyl-Q(34) synthetase GluQRS [Caldimonas sp.]